MHVLKTKTGPAAAGSNDAMLPLMLGGKHAAGKHVRTARGQEEQRRPEVAGEGRGGTPDVRAVIRIHRRATAATFGLRGKGARKELWRAGGQPAERVRFSQRT